MHISHCSSIIVAPPEIALCGHSGRNKAQIRHMYHPPTHHHPHSNAPQLQYAYKHVNAPYTSEIQPRYSSLFIVFGGIVLSQISWRNLYLFGNRLWLLYLNKLYEYISVCKIDPLMSNPLKFINKNRKNLFFKYLCSPLSSLHNVPH